MPALLIPVITSSLQCPAPSIFPTLATTNEHLNLNSSAGEQHSKFPATLSAGLAIGVVLCPVLFFLLLVAFIRVSQRRNLLPEWVTEPFRAHEQELRTTILNWMARHERGAHWGTSHPPQAFPNHNDGESDANEPGSESPILPQYTPPVPLPPYPPPVYYSPIFSTSTPPGEVE